MAGFPTMKGSLPWLWLWIGSCCLYLHAKFHWNRRNFLWTDGRSTYAPTDRRTDDLRSALLCQLCRRAWDSKGARNFSKCQPIFRPKSFSSKLWVPNNLYIGCENGSCKRCFNYTSTAASI